MEDPSSERQLADRMPISLNTTDKVARFH